MKRPLTLLLACMMVASLAACGENNTTDRGSSASAGTPGVSGSAGSGGSETPGMITVKTLNDAREEVEIEVPYDPQRIAVMDLAVLDILDNLGVGDRVVGVSKGSSIDYLQDYVTNDAIANLGTIKEADLEAVMACDPDVIFIGSRLAAQYNALSEIAPVVFLSIDAEVGVVKSTSDNAMNIATLFGLEHQVSGLMANYEARIAALQAFAEGKTAIVGIVNAGGFSVLGNDGRCSIIGVEIGFENIGVDASIDTATHGNEASFEFVVERNPDYIFAMDRDAAIGTEGAQLAAEVMDNELINMTAAAQNGHVIVLEQSNVWYTAEGGITALGIMLSDLERALLG